MREFINKVVNDTMKTPSGKWSMKRLTAFVVMVFILALGTFITLSDMVLKEMVNPYGIQIFNSLLIFEVSLMGLNEIGKKFINKPNEQEQG